MKETVVVGMSGGVDSSVTVHVLMEQGYEVVGATLEMWRDYPEVCEDGIEAAQTARQLGIKHEIIHYKDEFERLVINDFVSEYLKGRTPNPCVKCNRVAKWAALLDYADKIGAKYVATGHYANIIKLPNGRYTVANAATAAKDQTYVLCMLTQEQLSRTLMPLGQFENKDEVRAIARAIELPSAGKKDSQDICFVDEDNYSDFLETRPDIVLPGPGNFVTKDGEILGVHKGITHYTIGQRKGLGISLGVPAFVTQIRPETGEVVVGFDEDVYSDSFICTGLNFVAVEEIPVGETVRLMCRIRYHHSGEECDVTRIDADKLQVKFVKPVRAITPGQTAVFYENGYIYAGGVVM